MLSKRMELLRAIQLPERPGINGAAAAASYSSVNVGESINLESGINTGRLALMNSLHLLHFVCFFFSPLISQFRLYRSSCTSSAIETIRIPVWLCLLLQLNPPTRLWLPASRLPLPPRTLSVRPMRPYATPEPPSVSPKLII